MPRWLKVYLALVPVFPPLYLAGFYGLKFLKGLSPLARYALFGFLGLELLAALLSPRPGISFVLALLRGLFILGLIGVGIWLRDSQKLGYLLYGYLVVYLLALWNSWEIWGIRAFKWARLVHPYYSTTSLALSAAVGIFLALTIYTLPRWHRLSAGLLALVILIFAGSRSAFIMLFFGALSALLIGEMVFLRVVGLTAIIMIIAYIVKQYRGDIFMTRLINFTFLNFRDQIWEGAITAFKFYPWSGVGPYQLGPFLKWSFKHGCHLWRGVEYLGINCPDWLEPFYGAWLIAHNTWLHALGETGIVGTLGWAVLYLFATYAVIKARDPLVAAIFFGFMAMGLVDNPTLVPSLSLAEVFWVAVGIAIARSGLAVPPDQLAAGNEGKPRLDAA